MKRFLDPNTYSEEPHGRIIMVLEILPLFFVVETALRNVSMVFRSHPEWTVNEPIRNIGEAFMQYVQLFHVFVSLICYLCQVVRFNIT